MSYQKKLQDPRWQKKRLKILERDNWSCTKCGDAENELHVHHKKYTGEPHEAPDDYLETLCRHCHSLFHFLKTTIEFNCPYKVAKSITGDKIFYCSLHDDGQVSFTRFTCSDESWMHLISFNRKTKKGVELLNFINNG